MVHLISSYSIKTDLFTTRTNNYNNIHIHTEKDELAICNGFYPLTLTTLKLLIRDDLN